MNNQGQSITNFKKGDIIIRTKPVPVSYMNFDETGYRKTVNDFNYSHTRTPVEFIAVENNLIYVRAICASPYGDGEKTIYIHPFADFCDNWALFVVPEGLTLEECASAI
jgi:hypothetical protein